MINECQIELIRVRAAASANAEDARVWRWYADLMEDRRIECRHKGLSWMISVDGREIADNKSFDLAIRSAYTMTRALSALNLIPAD